MGTISIRKKGLRNYNYIWSQLFDDLQIWSKISGKTKILIKPNWVTYKSSDTGVTTDVALVKGLVQILAEDKRLKITVGESSLSDTGHVFSYLGVSELNQCGCEVINFDKGNWVPVASPLKLVLERFLIPEAAYQAEVIFTLGKMKTHALTGVSLGIKNFIGLLSKGGRKVIHLRDIDKGILDVFAYFRENKIVISVIDGLTALEGRRGPIHGKPVSIDCMFASDDPLLSDVICTQAMGVELTVIRHLRLATRLNLGICKPNISFGLNISDISRSFKMPSMFRKSAAPWDEWLAKKLFYKYPQIEDNQACVQCGTCEKTCPIGCAKLVNGSFTYGQSDCMHCLCCVEACTTGALGYNVKNRQLYSFLWGAWKRGRAH